MIDLDSVVEKLMVLFESCGFKTKPEIDAQFVKLTCTNLGRVFKFIFRIQTRKLIFVEVPTKIFTGWIQKEHGQVTSKNVIVIMDRLLIMGGFKSEQTT